MNYEEMLAYLDSQETRNAWAIIEKKVGPFIGSCNMCTRAAKIPHVNFLEDNFCKKDLQKKVEFVQKVIKDMGLGKNE